jgi:hypothetical protein
LFWPDGRKKSDSAGDRHIDQLRLALPQCSVHDEVGVEVDDAVSLMMVEKDMEEKVQDDQSDEICRDDSKNRGHQQLFHCVLLAFSLNEKNPLLEYGVKMTRQAALQFNSKNRREHSTDSTKQQWSLILVM